MAKITANFDSAGWSEAEINWLDRMMKKDTPRQEMVDALNRRYHKKKKVRTISAVTQRIVRMRKEQGLSSKKPKSTALAKRVNSTPTVKRKPRAPKVEVLPAHGAADFNEAPKLLFALQTPKLNVQIQLSGEEATDEMLKGMAAEVLDTE